MKKKTKTFTATLKATVEELRKARMLLAIRREEEARLNHMAAADWLGFQIVRINEHMQVLIQMIDFATEQRK